MHLKKFCGFIFILLSTVCYAEEGSSTDVGGGGSIVRREGVSVPRDALYFCQSRPLKDILNETEDFKQFSEILNTLKYWAWPMWLETISQVRKVRICFTDLDIAPLESSRASTITGGESVHIARRDGDKITFSRPRLNELSIFNRSVVLFHEIAHHFFPQDRFYLNANQNRQERLENLVGLIAHATRLRLNGQTMSADDFNYEFSRIRLSNDFRTTGENNSRDFTIMNGLLNARSPREKLASLLKFTAHYSFKCINQSLGCNRYTLLLDAEDFNKFLKEYSEEAISLLESKLKEDDVDFFRSLHAEYNIDINAIINIKTNSFANVFGNLIVDHFQFVNPPRDFRAVELPTISSYQMRNVGNYAKIAFLAYMNNAPNVFEFYMQSPAIERENFVLVGVTQEEADSGIEKRLDLDLAILSYSGFPSRLNKIGPEIVMPYLEANKSYQGDSQCEGIIIRRTSYNENGDSVSTEDSPRINSQTGKCHILEMAHMLLNFVIPSTGYNSSQTRAFTEKSFQDFSKFVGFYLRNYSSVDKRHAPQLYFAFPFNKTMIFENPNQSPTQIAQRVANQNELTWGLSKKILEKVFSLENVSKMKFYDLDMAYKLIGGRIDRYPFRNLGLTDMQKRYIFSLLFPNGRPSQSVCSEYTARSSNGRENNRRRLRRSNNRNSEISYCSPQL